MGRIFSLAVGFLAALALVGGTPPASAEPTQPAMASALHWRMIGPFRGGRTAAVTGIPSQPNVFFIAAVNGGIWKTTDYGQTWAPIFDGQPSGSVGTIAIAPSNPQVMYAGSGEGLQRPDLSTGDGMYKSIDGGATWTHLGLRDGQQIAKIVVDPKDPNRLYVAVLGHPYGPNTERGVYRSTDGGATFERVLYKNENAGAVELAMDPSNAQTLYAELWSARRPPWTTGGSYERPDAGTMLYKSTDGGTTWAPLTTGLPTQAQGLGRIGLGIAPSDPTRIFAMVDSPSKGGVYRSDDAGATWVQTNAEERVWGRGDDFAGVTVDPEDKETIYVSNTSTYRSTDAGKTFTAIKGAPGGDDYHTTWINPLNRNIIILGSDQGATVSVNRGATWSSWYNQPTAQFYHVIADDRYPYWVYGGQQESGSIGTASRGNDGEITFREWHSVGTEEYGYVAPDPLHPNLIYGGKATRFDWSTGQTRDVSPVVLRGPNSYRFNRTAPLLFSKADPHALYLGSNVVFRTTNGGESWDIISPDLTRPNPGTPPNFAFFSSADPRAGKHRGVVYALAPSPIDRNLLWAGTDDGLAWVTPNGGKTWNQVTPPGLTAWSKFTQIDASHFDRATAYASVSRFRLNDLHPYIFRTHDGGKSWTKITAGLPDDASVNTVREDPLRRGLLFAGTERTVYVSFDDGGSWQSLQRDLPSTSIRDLVIHGDDIVVGTHGRSFWILDDITPLRQATVRIASEPLHLFTPQTATRVRRSTNPDTPLPPEVPAGENPPDGAIVDYALATATSGPLTLTVTDAAGKIVRRFSSADKADTIDPELNVPTYWIRPFRPLTTSAGMHRFVWDLHEASPASVRGEYPISAVYRDTPHEPLGPAVLPGRYTLTLATGTGRASVPLVVRMDPRVPTSRADLGKQYVLASQLRDELSASFDALTHVRSLGAQLDERKKTAKSDKLRATIDALSGALKALSFDRLNGQIGGVYNAIEASDDRPATQYVGAARDLRATLDRSLAAWRTLQDRDVPRLNAALNAAALPKIQLGKTLVPRIETGDKDALP